PAAERGLVQLEIVAALAAGRVRPRQDARAPPIGPLAEPQVEARGLDLVVGELGRRDDAAAVCERRDQPVRQDAFVVDAEREGQGPSPKGAETSIARPS